MKKMYITPELELLNVENSDIICISERYSASDFKWGDPFGNDDFAEEDL